MHLPDVPHLHTINPKPPLLALIEVGMQRKKAYVMPAPN
jgi:hypothetical protein